MTASGGRGKEGVEGLNKKEKGLRHGKWLLLREGGRRGLIRNRKNKINGEKQNKDSGCLAGLKV